MYKYILRFSLVPTLDFDQKITALLNFVNEAKIDDVMFFIAPEELSVGHITIDMAKNWVQLIKKAKKILNKKGVTVSLNPWVTLNHYDGGRKLFKEQNFTKLIGQDGIQCKTCVCPLCENWRKYFVELWSYYINEIQPDVIWFEDDMRLTNHEPVIVGCFCDKHMKLYNEYLGTNYDRQTFVNKLKTDENCRRAYYEIGKFTTEDTFNFIISSLPNQKRFGLMTGVASGSLVEGRVYDNIYDILAKNGCKPYNRVHLGAYRQVGMQQYAYNLNNNAFLMRNLGSEKAYFFSEIENYPHSIYSKSANFFRYQLLTSVPLLLSGATLSIFDFHGNGVIEGDRYAKVLRMAKPYLNKVESFNLSPKDQVGVYCLYNQCSSVTINPVQYGVNALNPTDNWWYSYLTGLGVASCLGEDIAVKNKIVAVAGQVLRNYTTIEINELFRNNFVLLNADAAETLINMGLGELIGAESYTWLKERGGEYSFEELATNEIVFGMKQLRATAQFFCGDYLKINYKSNIDKKVYTNMLSFNQTISGCGITRINNALIFPLTGRTVDFEMPISLFCHLRAYALKTALSDSLYYNELYFVKEENVCPYVFIKDSKIYIMCVNFSDDGYNEVNIDTMCKLSNIQVVTPLFEEEHDVKCKYENRSLNIQIELLPQSSSIIICGNQN